MAFSLFNYFDSITLITYNIIQGHYFIYRMFFFHFRYSAARVSRRVIELR
jgi:hypothetical protein